MKETDYSSLGERGMEDRLWNYIDGQSTVDEKTTIEKLLETNRQWKEKYHELLEVHQIMQNAELEEPSLRFTKNVMEEIARYHIAPATKTYINKRIIWGIASFFFVLIFGMLVYGFGQLNWSAGNGSRNLPVDLTKIDLSRFFNNTYLNVFIMITVVFGLFVIDRVLTQRKKDLHKEA